MGRVRRSSTGLLADRHGLSALEYAVLFVLLVVALLVMWQRLGSSLTSQVARGGSTVSDELGRALQGELGRTPVGPTSPAAPVSASQNNQHAAAAHSSRPSAATSPSQASASQNNQHAAAAHSSSPVSAATSSSSAAPQAAQNEATPEPSWWDRTRATVRESTLGQAVLGIGYGVQSSFTPGGFLAPNPSSEPAFQVGRGLGEMAGGVVQMAGGNAMTGAGTGLAAGGLVAEGPSLGTSTVAVVGGAALATAGVAVTAHGAVNVAAGASQIINAARGSGDGPENPPSPSEAELARRRKLGEDPATGQHRPGEQETALRVEQATGKQLERFKPKPGEKGDWVDSSTPKPTVYDGCSPAPSKFFDKQWRNYKNSLNGHIKHPTVDKVVVDVTNLNLSPSQLQQLVKYLDDLPVAEAAKIVRIGF